MHLIELSPEIAFKPILDQTLSEHGQHLRDAAGDFFEVI